MFRFVTQTVTINSANQVVNFTRRIDKKAVLVTGITATVTTSGALHATKQLADVSMVFADRGRPLHMPVESKPISGHKKFGMVEVEQPLPSNVNIEGYVNDLGNSTRYPYNVDIYFRVQDNPEK